MNKFNKKLFLAFGLAFICLFVIVPFLMNHYGIRLDRSGSLPNYVYKESVHDVINLGDVVMFCPDDEAQSAPKLHGTHFKALGCDDNAAPFLKIVVAKGSGVINYTNGEYSLGGTGLGLPLPVLYRCLGRDIQMNDDDLFVVGTHPLSNDSRFFGPINKNDILSVMEPVL